MQSSWLPRVWIHFCLKIEREETPPYLHCLLKYSEPMQACTAPGAGPDTEWVRESRKPELDIGQMFSWEHVQELTLGEPEIEGG